MTANFTTPAPSSRIDAVEWLTAEEAARYLKVKAKTIQRWAREGKIQAYSLSGAKRRLWRFRRTELDAAVVGSAVNPR